jgi:hypothetical protein
MNKIINNFIKMKTIDLKINLSKPNILINKEDEENLSFIVSRAFEEYMEQKQDKILSNEIKKSKELDKVLSNLKI